MYAFRYINELRKNPEIELTLLTDVAASQEIKALESAGVPVITYGKAIFRSSAGVFSVRGERTPRAAARCVLGAQLSPSGRLARL